MSSASLVTVQGRNVYSVQPHPKQESQKLRLLEQAGAALIRSNQFAMECMTRNHEKTAALADKAIESAIQAGQQISLKADKTIESAIQAGQQISLKAVEAGRSAVEATAGTFKQLTEDFAKEREKIAVTELYKTHALIDSISKMEPERAVGYAKSYASDLERQINRYESKETFKLQLAERAEKNQRSQARKQKRVAQLQEALSLLKNASDSAGDKSLNQMIQCALFGALCGLASYAFFRSGPVSGAVAAGSFWAVREVKKFWYGNEEDKIRWLRAYEGTVRRMRDNSKLKAHEAFQKQIEQDRTIPRGFLQSEVFRREWEAIPEEEGDALAYLKERVSHPAYTFTRLG